MNQALRDSFTAFMNESADRIQQALMASLGLQIGQEAAAEALLYAWEHWPRVVQMENPAGYIYRVGRNKSRRLIRRPPPGVSPRPQDQMPWVEPGLRQALGRLTEKQRIATVLVHAGGWTYAEVAEMLGVDRGTVQKHARRGIAKLRVSLKVKVDV